MAGYTVVLPAVESCSRNVAPNSSSCCWSTPWIDTVGSTTPLVPTCSPAIVTASVGLSVGTVRTPESRTLNSCASAESCSAGSVPIALGSNCATAIGSVGELLLLSICSVKPVGVTLPPQKICAAACPSCLNSNDDRYPASATLAPA